MRAVLVSVVVFAAGCAFPQVVPEALSEDYKPTGEVKMYDRGATFDAVRVRSPHSNLSKRTDGSWGGVLEKQAIDVTVTDTTSEANVDTIKAMPSGTNRRPSIPGSANSGRKTSTMMIVA